SFPCRGPHPSLPELPLPQYHCSNLPCLSSLSGEEFRFQNEKRSSHRRQAVSFGEETTSKRNNGFEWPSGQGETKVPAWPSFRGRVGLHEPEAIALGILGVTESAQAGDRHLREDDGAAPDCASGQFPGPAGGAAGRVRQGSPTRYGLKARSAGDTGEKSCVCVASAMQTIKSW